MSNKVLKLSQKLSIKLKRNLRWKLYFSTSAKETLNLAKHILEEACNSSDSCTVQLFYTCRNIFEMYAGLVPEHHRIFLETVPHQVGEKLMYNIN